MRRWTRRPSWSSIVTSANSVSIVPPSVCSGWIRTRYGRAAAWRRLTHSCIRVLTQPRPPVGDRDGSGILEAELGLECGARSLMHEGNQRAFCDVAHHS